MSRSVWRYLGHRGRFLALFGLAVLLTAGSAAYFARFLLKPSTGLVVNFPEVVVRDGRVLFAPKTPFSPAVASGLRPQSDVLLRVNGRPIRGSWDVVAADAGIRGFEPFPVEVDRPGGPATVMLRPALTPARVDWLFLLLIALVLGFTAFYLILNLPEDTASNWIALASLFYLVFTCLKPFYYESFLTNLLIHLGKLSSWFMVFFALSFPYPRGRPALRRALVAGVLALYGLFIAARMACYSAWSGSGAEHWLSRYRFLGQLGNVSDAAAFLLYAVLLLTAYLRTSRSADRRRIEWLLAGFLIAIPPYFFLDQLPLILGEPPGWRVSMGSFANLFLVFVPLFFIVGLLKHRSINLRFFVHRYLVYLILAVLSFAFFTLAFDPAQAALARDYGLPARVAGFLVSALLFVAVLPLRAALTRLMERIFYRAEYRRSPQYAAGLEQSNRELRALVEELNLQGLRRLQDDKLRELRGILTGVARRLRGSTRAAAAGLAAAERGLRAHFEQLRAAPAAGREEVERREGEIAGSLRRAREENLRVMEFLQRLGALTGAGGGAIVPVELSRLLQEAGREIRRRHPGIALEEPPPSAGLIRCDPAEVVQALLFAADNAVEASADGAGDVRLGGGLEGSEAFIELGDRGAGIDPPVMRKALEPFYTTKAGHEGLGLYFCRLIVERNSGRLLLRSTPGEGTRVRFLFPAAPPECRPLSRGGVALQPRRVLPSGA